MGLLDNLLAPFGTSAQTNAAQAQQAALANAQAQGGAALGQGRTDIQNAGAAALAPLTSNFNMANQGTNYLAKLLGLSGNPADMQTALAATPGYQFALNQGTQNVDRNAAATGSLNSGNTDKAVADYTTGLANQTYQNAVGNLQPYLGMATNTGGQIANTNLATGGQLASNQAQKAGLLAGTDIGAGNAAANAALAPVQAGNNLWGLAGNLAKLGVSGSPGTGTGGGGTLGGNILSAAGGLFGNIFNPQQTSTAVQQ